MALYNQGHSSCSAYRTIARKSQHTPVLQNPYNDQPRGLPWLFWGLLTGETSIQILARIPTLTVSISHVTRLYLIYSLFQIGSATH